MTQAIALAQALSRQGIEIKAVIVGTSPQRKLPQFFIDSFSCPVVGVPSPNFVPSSRNRGCDLARSLLWNAYRFGEFVSGVRQLARILKELRPRLVINFFEPLGAVYALCVRNRPDIYAVANQYAFLLDDYRFPSERKLEQWIVRKYTAFNAMGAAYVCALSFCRREGNGRINVAPPLLRDGIRNLKISKNGPILVYLLNNGYIDDVIKWHARHPHEKVICFTDAVTEPQEIRPNLVVRGLCDNVFLSALARAKAVVTTAGFQVISEAAFLGKGILCMPVENHFEQFCNSRQVDQYGLGVFSDDFSLHRLGKVMALGGAEGVHANPVRRWVEAEATHPLVAVIVLGLSSS